MHLPGKGLIWPWTASSGSALFRPNRTLVEVVVAAAVSVVGVGFYWKMGATPTLMIGVLGAAVLLGLSSPSAFAGVILLLGPLPSIGALVGVTIPVGLDPVNWLLVLGLGLAAQKASTTTFRGHRPLIAAALFNLGILFFEWYRTYGQGSVSVSDLALVIQPIIVVAAGFAIVFLLPPQKRLPTIALSMGALLVVVAVSVYLQRLGLYTTAYQASAGDATTQGAKQYGGVMLSGNGVGSLTGIFLVPAFMLLRATGYRRFANALLVLVTPALFIAGTRGGLTAVAAGVVTLLVLGRDRLRILKPLVAVVALVAIWGATIGHSEVNAVYQKFSVYQTDPNAGLSGRQQIWREVGRYLNDQPSRLYIGGGLDDFRSFVGSTSQLEEGLNAHNAALRLLTDGGILALAGYLLLLVMFWRTAARGDPTVRTAIRVAIVSCVVFGAAHNLDLFTARVTWLWVLAALATAQAAERVVVPARRPSGMRASAARPQPVGV